MTLTVGIGRIVEIVAAVGIVAAVDVVDVAAAAEGDTDGILALMGTDSWTVPPMGVAVGENLAVCSLSSKLRISVKHIHKGAVEG